MAARAGEVVVLGIEGTAVEMGIEGVAAGAGRSAYAAVGVTRRLHEEGWWRRRGGWES
jgi:hypothetical protein